MKNKKHLPKKNPLEIKEDIITNKKVKKIKAEKVKYRHKNHWLEEAYLDLKSEEE